MENNVVSWKKWIRELKLAGVNIVAGSDAYVDLLYFVARRFSFARTRTILSVLERVYHKEGDLTHKMAIFYGTEMGRKLRKTIGQKRQLDDLLC